MSQLSALQKLKPLDQLICIYFCFVPFSLKNCNHSHTHFPEILSSNESVFQNWGFAYLIHVQPSHHRFLPITDIKLHQCLHMTVSEAAEHNKKLFTSILWPQGFKKFRGFVSMAFPYHFLIFLDMPNYLKEKQQKASIKLNKTRLFVKQQFLKKKS